MGGRVNPHKASWGANIKKNPGIYLYVNGHVEPRPFSYRRAQHGSLEKRNKNNRKQTGEHTEEVKVGWRSNTVHQIQVTEDKHHRV